MRQREPKNLQEDLNKYREMCDIADKLVEVSAGRRKLNSGDRNMIKFMQDKEKVDALLNKLDNPTQAEKYLSHIRSSDKDRDTQFLLDKMGRAKRQRRTIQLRRMTSVAAILIASFCIFYIINGTKESVQIVGSTMNPHYDVPVIVLPDGGKIDLSHAIVDKSEVSKHISIVDKQSVKYNSEGAATAEEEYNTIIIPKKQTFSIELSDGTQVMLNANSSLKYPVNFNGDIRNVELKGEAYFKVAKSSKPFIVKIGDCAVKVYGTEFNINTNRENSIETILIEGSIGFTTSADNEIMLKPNQMMKMSKDKGDYRLSYVNVNKYLGWKTGCFFYEQESLNVILNDIASWHGVSFIMDNKNIGSIELSINLDRNMRLSDLLSNLEKTLKVKFINEGNNQYIVL